jgi:hypothetical protein
MKKNAVPTFLLALACSAPLATSTRCFSQAGDAAAASVMFREGRKALEAGNFQEACQKFTESQRLDPAAGTLMNLATCEQELGKLASAWQHWKEAIEGLPAGDDRIAFARVQVGELEKRLPRLTVTLAAGKGAGARVFRDDVELGAASQGVALPIDPGPHAVTVQTPGHRTETTAFSVAEAEQKQLDVHPGPEDAEAPLSADFKMSSRMVGWALGGVGLAGLATAVITGVTLSNKKSTVAAECPNKLCSTQEGLDAAASGRTLLVVNSASWIVGAVGLGVGAYFVLSSSSQPSSAVVAIDGGRDFARLSYRGRF